VTQRCARALYRRVVLGRSAECSFGRLELNQEHWYSTTSTGIKTVLFPFVSRLPIAELLMDF
jgi:hypothetical protein